MPHHPTQRRNLAASDPKTSMDPTNKKHPISSTTTTIHPITKHYPKFNSNHKARTSLKTTDPPPPPPPRVDTHLQAKALAASTIAASNTSLTNSNRRHGTRINVSETEEESKVRAKARSEKGREKKEAHERRSDVMNRACVSLAVSGKRRSFCDSHVELADFFSCTGVKVVSVDMPPFMQIHAVDFARKAYDSLEKFTSKTLASTLKKEFDGVYGPAWHCILGTSFGSFVTHSVGGFLYFSMDQKLYVLLFKTTVQRAD